MDWFRKFMAGRYGADQLTVAVLVLYAVLYLLSQLTRSIWLFWIAVIVFAICVFRMFSRNTSQRYKENMAFLRWWNPVASWFRKVKYSVRDHKVYRYYKCPNCSNRLRVPRGKGKIQITCPVCRTEFIKKT